MYVDIDVRKVVVTDRATFPWCLHVQVASVGELFFHFFPFRFPVFSIISQPLSLLSYPHIPVFSIISSDLSLFFLILIYRNTLFFYLDSHSSDQYFTGRIDVHVSKRETDGQQWERDEAEEAGTRSCAEPSEMRVQSAGTRRTGCVA